MNCELTDDQVWNLVSAGCNVAEIAEYIGISRVVAYALMARATRLYAQGGGAP